MLTYLTIITTILVLTQVIRLIQNSLHLRHFRRIEDKNDYIVAVWRKFERALATWEAEQAERAKAACRAGRGDGMETCCGCAGRKEAAAED